MAIHSKGGTTIGVGRSVIVAVVAIVGTTIETGYAQSLAVAANQGANEVA